MNTLEFERPITELEAKIADLARLAETLGSGALEAELQAMKARADELRRNTYCSLDAWQKTQVARHPGRPHCVDYLSGLIDDERQHPFAICDGDRLVGLVCVTLDAVNRVGWFWYWTNASHRGRGWASTCATAVANWALSAGGCERLELGHRADNPLSGNVAGRAGFVREGRERGKFLIDGQRVDVLTYGRLATDPWPAATLEVSW